ncbi:MAG: hypothetical protein HS111_08640 [Kofleriaceae bacterium]|nr:hypothetical protein [Kofleriaceae bacterium]
MAKRFGAERVRRIVDELVAAGELRPGEVDLRFLTMIPTHHFGERLDGNPEETHAPRELEPTPQPDGTARSGFEVKLDQMLEQIGARGDTVGIDIASLERYHFDEKGREAFKTMYVRLVTVARQRGQQVVLRPHVGEGSVDNAPGRPFDRDADRKRTPGGELTHQARARHNVEQLLVALEQLRAAGELDPAVVVVRFGHATVATPDHVRRMHALGVIAEVNLGSNVRTGAADQTVRGEDGETSPVEQFDDHALPTMLYYDAQVVLSTDAHDVMQTTLRQEYDRGHRVIEEILAGERAVRVRAADAGERGTPVGDATDDRWLSIEDMTAAERDRFQRGYEKLHADAQGYYRHRPRPEATAARNPRGAASPQGGAHWTDTARAHGLRAIHGQRRFAGTRADVERAVAAYRKEGATALPISTHPDDIVYRVTSPDGRAELELEGWGPRHDADHLPIADLDRALATNAGVRDWYNGEVARIGAQNAAWKAAGVPLEARARRAYEVRHQARLKARQMMRRRDEVDRVEARDQVKYGDLDGPTFDQLLAESMGQGLTREQALERILGSSTQTSEEYNRRSRAQGGKP